MLTISSPFQFFSARPFTSLFGTALLLLPTLWAPTSLAESVQLSRLQQTVCDRVSPIYHNANNRLGKYRDLSQYPVSKMLTPGHHLVFTKAMNAIMTADKELPQIRQKLSDTNIPFDHPCTAGIVAKSDALLAEVTEMKIHFEKIQQAKQQLQDPGQFPNLQTDLQTLEAWKVNYGFRQFRRNPERFGQLAKDLPHATTQLHAIHKKYSLLMTQPFTHAQTMKREIQWTQVSIQKFVDQTQAYLKNSIQKIEDINQNANEWAQSGEGRLLKRAKDELNEVEPDLRAIEAILTKPQDIQKIKSLKTAHAAAKAKVNGQISRHRQAVLASTRLPDEVYTGSDKESLRTGVIRAWRKAYPNDEVLMVRFNRTKWERSTEWKQNSVQWYKTDVSALAVRVVVKHSATTARLYVAYINKNHMKGSQDFGVRTKNGGYVVNEMLLSNL